jgi:hypothetical protein
VGNFNLISENGVDTKQTQQVEDVEYIKSKQDKKSLKNKKPSLEISTNKPDMKRTNNDPINFKDFNKEIETIDNKTKASTEAKEYGYNLELTEIYCKCLKSKRSMIKEKYFLNACSLYDYYLDITTYFKKMMEIDIIKFFLFSHSERKLVSILSNPDFTVDKEEILEKLKHQYRPFDAEKFEFKAEMILKDVLKEGRDKTQVNKLLKMVQNGNQIIFDY